MFNSIINEQDCDKRLAEFKYNAKDKCYDLVKNFKFNSKVISIDRIKESFINKNKKFNNDYAYMILDADRIPTKCIPVPCKICSLS